MTSRDTFDSDVSSDSSQVDLLLTAGSENKMAMFSTMHAVCDNMRLLLDMEHMCDITFLVGFREVPVHALRAVLASRSKVFYNLIKKHTTLKKSEVKRKTKGSKDKKPPMGIARQTSDTLVIPVQSYDPETFRALVEFVHCGSVLITEDTVAGLFCGAHQFALPDLTRACLDFVDRCVKHGRCENVMFSARCYVHHSASQMLFDIIHAVKEKRLRTDVHQTSV